MRTFIAIDLETAIKDRLCALIRELDSGNKNVKWIKRQALHLTLKFCGDIPTARIEAVKKALEAASSRCQDFPLNIYGTGRFPSGSRNPRVLWVGIQPNPLLQSLQKEVDMSLKKLGIPKEQRPYFPHLTLGRVKSSIGIEDILKKMDSYLTHTFGTMNAGKMTFFQSILKPSGAEYTVLHEVNFL